MSMPPLTTAVKQYAYLNEDVPLNKKRIYANYMEVDEERQRMEAQISDLEDSLWIYEKNLTDQEDYYNCLYAFVYDDSNMFRQDVADRRKNVSEEIVQLRNMIDVLQTELAILKRAYNGRF